MRTRNRIVLAALATLGALLGSTAPASSIVGGIPDGNRHPNVGVLAWDADGLGPTPAFTICTGAVISDHAFLTARHCIEPPLVPLPPMVQWAVTLEPGSASAPIAPTGFISEYPACCGLTVPESQIARATGVVLHPDYEPGFVPGQSAPTAGAHDVAVVLFPKGTFAGVKPVDLARPGTLDRVRPHGRRHAPDLTLVGYGAELRDGAFFVNAYRKTARAPIADVDPNWLLFANTVTSQPRSGAGCYGDSGSPQFLAGSDVQVSILHDGGANCSGTGYAQRIDTRSEHDFIAPYLPRRSRGEHR